MSVPGLDDLIVRSFCKPSELMHTISRNIFLMHAVNLINDADNWLAYLHISWYVSLSYQLEYGGGFDLSFLAVTQLLVIHHSVSRVFLCKAEESSSEWREMGQWLLTHILVHVRWDWQVCLSLPRAAIASSIFSNVLQISLKEATRSIPKETRDCVSHLLVSKLVNGVCHNTRDLLQVDARQM